MPKSTAAQPISAVVVETLAVTQRLTDAMDRISDAELTLNEDQQKELLTAARAIRNALIGVTEVASLECRRLGL